MASWHLVWFLTIRKFMLSLARVTYHTPRTSSAQTHTRSSQCGPVGQRHHAREKDQSCTSGRSSPGEEQGLAIGGIMGGVAPLLGEAALDAVIPVEEVEHDAQQPAEVLRRLILAGPVAVLPEDHVEHPVALVFNALQWVRMIRPCSRASLARLLR